MKPCVIFCVYSQLINETTDVLRSFDIYRKLKDVIVMFIKKVTFDHRLSVHGSGLIPKKNRIIRCRERDYRQAETLSLLV